MLILICCVVVLAVAATPSEAHAYLDPGTGSMVLQIVVGLVTGGVVALRMYWHRLKSGFAGPQPPTEAALEAGEAESEPCAD